jgi:hypothetical protein
MFRSLLSLAAIAAILAATLILPTETQARRCPVEIPETLLSLYKGSDVIVIATFDRTEDGAVEKTEHYTIVNTKNYYTVATTLKGEQQKMLVLEEQDYRYEPEEKTDEPVVDSNDGEVVMEMEESPESIAVEPGDTVLMFLTKGEHDEEESEKPAGLQPVGYRDGIKKMSGDVLRTYEHRINQLNVIFNSAGNRDAAIVNWLIDVTEDPITRWEGAFELLQGFQELEWAEEEAKRQDEAEKEPAESDEAETTEEGEEAESEDAESMEEDTSGDRLRYARLITDGHKQALLNILLSSVPAKAEGDEPTVVSQGDQVLMQLVKNWGDERLAGFLLDQLRTGAGDSYYKYQLMETIASSLNEKKLTAIVEEYGDRLYEEDSTVIEDSQPEEIEGEPVIENPNQDVPAEGETVEPVDGETETEANAKKTYGERRAELIAKFIHAADQRIATGAQ